jgi:hypothetical protein
LKVTGTGNVQLTGNTQKYTFSGSGSTSTSLSLQSDSSGVDSSVEFFTLDGDTTDNNNIRIFGKGTREANTDSELVSLGWDSGTLKYKLLTSKTGTGVLRDISIESGITNQILLRTSGSTLIGGAMDVTELLSASSTEANSLTVYGGATITKGLNLSSFININGVNVNTLLTGTTTSNAIFTGNGTSNIGLVLQSNVPILTLMSVGTIGSTNTESFNITSSTLGTTLTTLQTGSGVLRPLTLGATSQLFLATSGNIGINTSTPDTNLTVNGNTRTTGLTVSNGILSNTLVISSTENSTVATNGSVYTFGGLGVLKDLIINGTVNVKSTEVGSINTLGGITVTKGINITGELTAGNSLFANITCASLFVSSTVNSTSITTGSEIISGGLGVKKAVYIGESVNVYGNANLKNTALVLQDSSDITRYSIEKDTTNFSINRYNATGVLIDQSVLVSNTTGDVTITNDLYAQKTLVVNSTSDTISNTSGSIYTFGGVGIAKDLNIGKTCTIKSTTDSSDINSGSLIIKGGVGITKNLNIGGNVIVTGTLIVNGTTTSINSTTTTITDNIIVVNSGPSGSRDAGLLCSRYQTENDTGLGDVVSDSVYVPDTLPDQSAMSSTQITLSTSASAADNYYTGWYIRVTSGFSSGQVRKITAYVGASRLATVAAWTSQNPSISDTVNIYNRPQVGLFYNELNDIFELTACVQDPGFASVVSTAYLGLKLDSLSVTTTNPSINSTSGSIISTGGIGLRCTSNATSSTCGGSITTLGGVGIAKDLYVGGNFIVGGVQRNSVSFTGANNQGSFVDVTSALIPSSSFGADIFLALRVTATANVYSNFHMRVINRGATWELTETYVGDDSGINFDITTGGQIQYTSPNFAGFTSLLMKFTIISN